MKGRIPSFLIPLFLFSTPLESRGEDITLQGIVQKREELSEILGLGRAGWFRGEMERPLARGMEASLPPPFEKLGTIEGGGYIIERVRVETAPGFYAVLNLYCPTGGEPPYPLIISPHGHWGQGKSAGEEQMKARSFARKGYVVALVDAVGVEEASLPPLHAHFERGLFNGAYLMAGGLTIMGVQVMNLVRTLDHLLLDPRIDRERIGSAGASGGATQAIFHAALDRRVKVLASSLYTTMTDPDEGDACICEILPRAGKVLSPPFLRLLPYPAAHLFISNTPDEYILHARKFYDEKGKGEKIRYILMEGGHGYSEEMLLESIRWFDRWFRRGRVSGNHFEETAAGDLPEETLRAGLPGDFKGLADLMRDLMGGEIPEGESRITGYGPFGRDALSFLTGSIEPGRGGYHLDCNDMEPEVPVIKRVIRRLFGYPIGGPGQGKRCRILNHEGGDAGTLYLPPWPFIPAPLFTLFPGSRYTPEVGRQDGVSSMPNAPPPIASELLTGNFSVYIPPLPPETEEARSYKLYAWRGEDILSPLIKGVVSVLSFLQESGIAAEGTKGVWGEGSGGIPSLFLAGYEGEKGILVLRRTPLSYLSPGIPRLPLISFPPGLYTLGDIQDILCHLHHQGVRLLLSSPAGLDLNPLSLHLPGWEGGGILECPGEGVEEIAIHEELAPSLTVDRVLEMWDMEE